MKKVLTVLLGAMFMVAVGTGPAFADKPAEGSSFETGTCTTVTGHGSNATFTTDTGACTSADNPNKGGSGSGWNTGHGFGTEPGGK
jgi:hypothetical protein